MFYAFAQILKEVYLFKGLESSVFYSFSGQQRLIDEARPHWLEAMYECWVHWCRWRKSERVLSGEQLEVASLPYSPGMSILLQIYAKKVIIDT